MLKPIETLSGEVTVYFFLLLFVDQLASTEVHLRDKLRDRFQQIFLTTLAPAGSFETFPKDFDADKFCGHYVYSENKLCLCGLAWPGDHIQIVVFFVDLQEKSLNTLKSSQDYSIFENLGCFRHDFGFKEVVY